MNPTHRHIILTLRRMTIKITLTIHRRNAIKSITHISADIVIPVLIERERAASVLHKQVQHADLVVTNLGDLRHNMIGDEIRAATARWQSESFLEPGHDVV